MKETINCYGDENKQKLIEKYNIFPILYLRLLPNQSKKGCCGKLTTNYYIFNAVNKVTKHEVPFYAGKHCAEEILRLIKKPKLELFNPLYSDNTVRNQDKNQTTLNKNNIYPVNKELMNAIQLISVAWSSPPPTFVLKIIEYTLNNPAIINYRGIKWTNDSICKDYQNRTLTQIVQDLKNENPNFRNFTFERLKNIMLEKFPEKVNKY